MSDRREQFESAMRELTATDDWRAALRDPLHPAHDAARAVSNSLVVAATQQWLQAEPGGAATRDAYIEQLRTTARDLIADDDLAETIVTALMLHVDNSLELDAWPTRISTHA